MKKSTIPEDLSPKSKEIWHKIRLKYHITDDWRPLLVESLRALDQHDKLKEIIEREGYTQIDRLGNEKQHCLLSAMEKCRQSFLTAWRQINLDVLPQEKDTSEASE